MKDRILSVQVGNDAIKLPNWLLYFVSLGEAFGKAAADRRHVVALSIPSRCFAAVFSATGFVIANGRASSVTGTQAGHFKELCGLKLRTPLTVLDDQKRYKGMFVGVHDMDGKPYVKVLLRTKDKLTYYYGEENAHKVIVAARDAADVPVRQAGRKFMVNKKFLRALLGGKSIDSFVSEADLYCDIFGTGNALRTEAEVTNLIAADDQGCSHYGSIQEVLRIKGIAGIDYGWHTEIISSAKNTLSPEIEERRPLLSIFDGALSFLKWRDLRRESSWIILLDRTDRNFDEAVSLVRSEFISSRRGEGVLDMPDSVPGVEVLQYYE